tara:strand:+ start:466 stop:2853 length:2388 start_codon:yes stop_codon:yes gene_type:complete
MTKFVKSFLVFIVLGLLFSGKVYAACSKASGDISGTSSGSPHTTTYSCADNNTFVLDAGEYMSGDPARITATADNITINNSGNLLATGGGNVITSGAYDTVTLTNQSTGVIKGTTNGIFIGAGDAWEIDNYGDIYGVSAKAVNIRGGDNTQITNRSGAKIRTDGLNAVLMQDSSGSNASETLTLDNYGTISGRANTVKIAVNSTGATINNYSGATIEATDTNNNNTNAKAAIRIDVNDVTVVNKGSLVGEGASASIRLKNDVTGTKIYVDETASFTGEVHLGNNASAAGSTIYLGCNISQDVTIEVKKKSKATITNNLCGNDTLTIQDNSNVTDADNSEANGYLVIDEGLEVESNNAKYRSENVATKLKGLFSAANYIDGVEPEDKFFRVFYSSVKREDMYEGSMKGVVGQLSPINWGNITSNVFLGYSEHHGDFDNGEFLGGGNYALGLKNVFTKNGLKVSFSPMIGLNSLDVTDFDSDSSAKVKTNLLSEFLAFNGKIDKEIQTSDDASLNLSVQSTLGLQRFPDYLSSFSDGDLSVDEAIEQVLSGGFEVKYNEKLGGGFIIKPYVGVTLNHNLNSNIDMTKDDDSLPASPADSSTAGYYAGLSLNKKVKNFNFDLDLMYGNEDGLINEIVAVSLTKTFGKVKTAKLEKKTDTSKIGLSSTTEDRDNQKDIEALRKAVEQMKAKNEALKAQNEKLKLLSEKVLEENKTSKNLIMDLIKTNEKIKLEKEILKNQILEKESEELREKIQESNKANKPSLTFLGFFGTIFAFVVLSVTSLIASIVNRIFYRSAKA